MYLTGVIGYPLKNTLSPLIHNQAFKALGLEGSYYPLVVPEDDFGLIIHILKKLRFCGFNLTNPYKIEILKYLEGISPLAQDIGAVNVVKIRNHQMYGFNTDVLGFIQSIKAHRLNLTRKKILIIGAGGVARAVGYAVAHARPAALFIANRTEEKAYALAQRYGGKTIPFEAVSEIIKEIDLVINATSVDIQSWLISHLKKGSIFYDTNYCFPSIPTKQVKTINGLEMLIYQAAHSFSIWTGKRPPLKVMKEAIKGGLND
ncbi:MAG: shikimate dehydrogenase [candidate division WOR-3 bacterium]